ncbi:MAG: hypothetical protein ACE37I_05090 [Rubinisphaera brasiliensis]|uniref:hypothetical protein n=1 Tax=Rubinisphaera brasiliensis TaxID=119 RepID=UPI003918DCC4
MILRQLVCNNSDQLMMVFTEPEAQDFWLKPSEQVTVQAEASKVGAQFEISFVGEGIVFFPDYDMGYISVWKDGQELDCGYQRPENWP